MKTENEVIDKSQEIVATMDGDIDTFAIKMKTGDGTEIGVENIIQTLLACTDKFCVDYGLELQDCIDEYMGEVHINEVKEGMH